MECQFCGVEFEPPAKSKRKTCSSSCAAKLGRPRAQAKKQEKKKQVRRWKNPHARGVKGARDDLHGIYMRSRWEANVARFLDVLLLNGKIQGWEYEPQIFSFPVKRGIKFYTPDFRILEQDGGHYWIEVKGWMDKPSRIKIKRFGIHYPKERLVLVDDKAYRALEKEFQDVIPNWEKAAS